MAGEITSRILQLVLTAHVVLFASALDNCPMSEIKSVVQRTIESVGKDAELQMPEIRRVVQNTYGGHWGVVIVTDPDLIGSTVHWSLPVHMNKDDTGVFCVYIENGWQYNVFKTADVVEDTKLPITVEQALMLALAACCLMMSAVFICQFVRCIKKRRGVDRAERSSASPTTCQTVAGTGAEGPTAAQGLNGAGYGWSLGSISHPTLYPRLNN